MICPRTQLAGVAGALLFILHSVAAAQSPRDTLTQAAEVITDLHGVRYAAVAELLGENGQPRGAVEAEVMLVRAPGASAFFNEHFLVRGVRTAPGEHPQAFTVSFDGERLQHIDHDRRLVQICDNPQPIEFMRLLGDIRFAIERQYVLKQPLGLALTPAVELTAEAKLDFHGIQCVRVEAVSSIWGREGQPVASRSVYWIGEDDHLIHGVESKSARLRLEGLETLTQDDVAAADFRPETPAGFGVVRYSEDVAPAAPPELLAAGDAAPMWSLSTFDGDPHSLADLRGDVVILDFSASWCLPCIRFMPTLQRLHEELSADGVRILCVNTPEPVVGASLEQLWKREGFTFALLNDADGAVRDDYRVTALPTLYILDRQGRVVWSHVGAGPNAETEIRRIVRDLLDDEGGTDDPVSSS